MSHVLYEGSRQLWSVRDLSPEAIGGLLSRAGALVSSAPHAVRPFNAALVFLQPSLRTQLGYAVAVSRLGGVAHAVGAAKLTAQMSSAESLEDTIRICAGYCDLIVLRHAGQATPQLRQAVRGRAFINGGDGAARHPSQALIDLFAIERLLGPVSKLRIAICGDASSRAAQSLLELFELIPPKSIHVVAPPSRLGPSRRAMPAKGSGDVAVIADVDVLYMAGLAPGQGVNHLDAAARERYSFNAAMASILPPSSIVLSPMPVIDEIAPECRNDPRVKIFEQSDAGLAMRMALVEWALGEKA